MCSTRSWLHLSIPLDHHFSNLKPNATSGQSQQRLQSVTKGLQSLFLSYLFAFGYIPTMKTRRPLNQRAFSVTLNNVSVYPLRYFHGDHKGCSPLAGVSVATVSRVINNSPKATKLPGWLCIVQWSLLAITRTQRPCAGAADHWNGRSGRWWCSDPFFGAMVKAVEQVAYHTVIFYWLATVTTTNKKSVRPLATDPPSLCCVGRPCQNDTGCDLASLMKQMPGMVLINRILLALKTVVLLWTIVTVPGWQRSFNSARSYPHWLSVF